MTTIGDGADPTARKRSLRTMPTVREAAREFIDSHVVRLEPATRTEYERLLHHAIEPALGRLMIRDVARADVTRYRAALKATPRKANFALAVLSKFMNWCEIQGLREANSNPCRKGGKYREVTRQRSLTDPEIDRVVDFPSPLKRDDRDDHSLIAAIRPRLLTGMRLGEVLPLEWRFVDLQRGLITLPDSKTGQKAVFLDAASAEVIAVGRPCQDGMSRFPRLIDCAECGSWDGHPFLWSTGP